MFALTEKEMVGVYLALESRAASLDATMARLRKRLEDSLLARLCVDDFERLEAVYGSLPDAPPVEQ